MTAPPFTARDFAQTLELCERFGKEKPRNQGHDEAAWAKRPS